MLYWQNLHLYGTPSMTSRISAADTALDCVAVLCLRYAMLLLSCEEQRQRNVTKETATPSNTASSVIKQCRWWHSPQSAHFTKTPQFGNTTRDLSVESQAFSIARAVARGGTSWQLLDLLSLNIATLISSVSSLYAMVDASSASTMIMLSNKSSL